MEGSRLPGVDHLVYVAPDLEEGISLIEDRLGVRAAPGGKHTGRGTHNALLSLGRGAYLEIIAPDPEQSRVTMPRAFGLDVPGQPHLHTWAVAAPDIERRIDAARGAGYVAQLLEMSRELPDGGILRWVLSFPPPLVGDGIVPFLIRWGRGPHPSETSPGGCELLDLLAEHPDPGPARALLAAMAVDLPLKPGPAPALIATVRCPRGLIELR